MENPNLFLKFAKNYNSKVKAIRAKKSSRLPLIKSMNLSILRNIIK